MRGGTDATSKLVFGDYDLKKYAAPGSTDGDIVWFPTSRVNKLAWALDVESIRFPGSTDNVNTQTPS